MNNLYSFRNTNQIVWAVIFLFLLTEFLASYGFSPFVF